MRRLISEMNKCKGVRKQFVSYLNGELGRRRHSKIERHLEKCPGCLREYQIEKRMEELLTSEMINAAHESDPLLTWDNLRQSLDREASAAKVASRWTQIEESWLTGLKEIALPKAAQTLSEVSYWGKRATAPAVIVLLAFTLYHAFQTPTYTPKSASTAASGNAPIVIKINFGPDMAVTTEGYYTDTGKSYIPVGQEKNQRHYRWRNASAG